MRHDRVDPVPQLRGERSDKGPSRGLVAIPDEGARARTVGDLGLAKRAPRGVDVLLGAQPQSLTRDAGPHADQLRSLALSAVGHPEYLHGVAAGVGIRESLFLIGAWECRPPGRKCVSGRRRPGRARTRGERGAQGRRRLQGAQSPAHGWQRHQHHNRGGEPRERRRRAGVNGWQRRFVSRLARPVERRESEKKHQCHRKHAPAKPVVTHAHEVAAHVGEIARLDDRIHAHPVRQQREARHQRQLRDADSPGVAPQLTVQRRHRESHDHEMQAAAAFLDHEGAVGDVDGLAKDQHLGTREPEKPAQGEHRELLQRVAELRPGRHGEVEKRHRESQQQAGAQTERCRDG